MGFSINDVNKLTFKVQAGGVIDAASGSRWYESRLAFSPKVRPDRILTDYGNIPEAGSLTAAQNAAAANPTFMTDLSAAANAVRLTTVTNGVNTTWAAYTTFNDSYEGKGVDQLQYIIDTLSNPETRSSRRMVMSAWNPCQLHEMALPPCHVLCQFNVIEDRLYCALYQRSGDIGLGVPFNIASYSILTCLLAHHCGLKAHEFHYYLENCHIYDDHIESLKIQSTREPFEFPTLEILGDPKTSIDQYVFEDFVLNDYKFAPAVKMDMRE